MANECGYLCDTSFQCQSFGHCDFTGPSAHSCYPTKKKLTENEEVNSGGKCSSYFQKCEGNFLSKLYK